LKLKIRKLKQHQQKASSKEVSVAEKCKHGTPEKFQQKESIHGSTYKYYQSGIMPYGRMRELQQLP
jgi:hypothetical protein